MELVVEIELKLLAHWNWLQRENTNFVYAPGFTISHLESSSLGGYFARRDIYTDIHLYTPKLKCMYRNPSRDGRDFSEQILFENLEQNF